jgi:hypothetical protein
LQSIFCTVHATLYVNTKFSHWQQKEMFSTNPALCKQTPTPWFSSTSKKQRKNLTTSSMHRKNETEKNPLHYTICKVATSDQTLIVAL